MKKVIVLLLLTSSTTMFAAVHPTKAQAAYFDEHDKCVNALRTAKKEAKTLPADRRKIFLDDAKKTYRQCEHHAHLVWKYYPHHPPSDPAQ